MRHEEQRAVWSPSDVVVLRRPHRITPGEAQGLFFRVLRSGDTLQMDFRAKQRNILKRALRFSRGSATLCKVMQNGANQLKETLDHFVMVRIHARQCFRINDLQILRAFA